MNISLAQSKMVLDGLQSPVKGSQRSASVVILICSLTAFAAFNYSTTVYALRSMLGGITSAGIHWSAVLAIAFCCIDIAGITRLFSPRGRSAKTKGDRYLFAAWLLTTCLNALLTWYGISMAVSIQQASMGGVVNSDVLIKLIPAFMVLMVWIIRILIIGALSRSNNPASGPVPGGASEPLVNYDPQIEGEDIFRSGFPQMESQIYRGCPISRPTLLKREPSYRGLPIRYKPF